MSTSFYDVLIAGTELPGLILGALCAKKGYRVLVIGQGTRRNRYLYGPHVFKRRNFLLPALDHSPPVRDVLNELSLSLEMRNRPRRSSPSYQVVMPDHRIDVDTRTDRAEAEYHREMPGELERIRGFETDVADVSRRMDALLKTNPPLPPDGWTEKREFQRITAAFPELFGMASVADPLDAFDQRHPFRRVALAPILMSSTLDLEEGPVLPRSRLGWQIAQGLYHLEGGFDSYRDIFVQKLRQHASDYRPDIALDGLMMKRGRAVEGYVRDRRESIGCHLIVCNSDVKRFFQLVPVEHQKERYHHRIHALQPSHYFFTVNLALARDGLPEGIAREVFVTGGDGTGLIDENLLMVQLEDEAAPPPVRGRGAGTGAAGPPITVATVMCRLRARSVTPNVSFVGELTHRVLRRLRESVFPFLDEHLLAVHCPWVATDPMTGEQRFEASELVPVYRSVAENTLDASVLPVLTEYRNVLVCGEPTFAGFGIEGAYLAALDAYRRVTERVVLKTLLS